MALSPRSPLSRRSTPPPHTRAASWPAARLVTLACALATLGVWALLAAPSVRADSQPTVTVSVKSGTATQTAYTVVASGFPAQTAYTETLGDGSLVAPSTGQTNASGSFTLWWTLDATTKYCGTITAQAGSASASASFWIALTSDAQSGTPCQGTAAGSGSPTPAGATPAATASPATPGATPAATQPPAPQPTVAPAAATTPASGTGLSALLGRIPWLWIGVGIIAVLLLLIVAVAMASGKNKPPSGGNRPSTRRFGASNRDPQWGPSTTNARQRAATRMPQQEMPPRGWPQQEPPRSSHRMPGAGNMDPRWRVEDPDESTPHAPPPNQRWSRSQPGARGNPPPRTLGDATSSRQRIVRHDDWDKWRR